MTPIWKRPVVMLFLHKMISSFYESRFTADRLGGGKKCIDFVFQRQWPLAAILRPVKNSQDKMVLTILSRNSMKMIKPVGRRHVQRVLPYTEL